MSDLLPPAGTDVVEAPETRWITDRWGRVVISHGINVVSAAKGAPDRLGGADEEVIADLGRALGFQRLTPPHLLGCHLAGPDSVNDRYLDLVEQRLDWYAEHGIYVILDMHQDILVGLLHR